MTRVRPAVLLAVLLLSACAAAEPRQEGAHARWLAEGPRTVRIVIDAPEGEPLYSVERHYVGEGAVFGAGAGLVVSGIFARASEGACDRACAGTFSVIMGSGVAIGALIGAVSTPGKTIRSLPLEEHETLRPLAPGMQRTGRDTVRRVVEMLAENMRREGGHGVSIVMASQSWCEPWCEPVDSEITVVASSVGLVGPGPDKSARASLLIAVEVSARWRGSIHKQRFRYRSEAAELSDWADPDGVETEQAARKAASNLSGRIFNALAEP